MMRPPMVSRRKIFSIHNDSRYSPRPETALADDSLLATRTLLGVVLDPLSLEERLERLLGISGKSRKSNHA